jgi:hypothetical protein
MCNGHLPRLARIVCQDHSYTRRIKHVYVDEAHNIYTAGLSHHGEEPFRPAYGKLGEFRVLLPKGIPFQMLSAMLGNVPDWTLASAEERCSTNMDVLMFMLS